MRLVRHIAIGLCILLPQALVLADAPAATQPATTDQFMRFVSGPDGGGLLQTAQASYKNAAGVKVDLIAAVHVGDSDYYKQLNQAFAGYDALLYELVKPEGAAPPPPGAKGGAVTGVQRGLTDLLQLEFQLDGIDYSAANFVHADLDAETFARMQQQRGESLASLMLRAMLADMTTPRKDGSNSDVEAFALLYALTSPDRARNTKYILARQFNRVEDQLSGLDGPNGSVLVTERNKAALRVLKDTLAAGKKTIGIFYGAAHMRDMERRLLDMGFTRTATEWRTAWRVQPPVLPGQKSATRPAAGQ